MRLVNSEFFFNQWLLQCTIYFIAGKRTSNALNSVECGFDLYHFNLSCRDTDTNQPLCPLGLEREHNLVEVYSNGLFQLCWLYSINTKCVCNGPASLKFLLRIVKVMNIRLPYLLMKCFNRASHSKVFVL